MVAMVLKTNELIVRENFSLFKVLLSFISFSLSKVLAQLIIPLHRDPSTISKCHISGLHWLLVVEPVQSS